MMFQTITILRGDKASPRRDEIDADVEGPFAIHEALPLELNQFAVTHVPTGYQVLAVEHEVSARAARAELLASDLDWTFDDPADVTAAHHAFGKALRQRYKEK